MPTLSRLDIDQGDINVKGKVVAHGGFVGNLVGNVVGNVEGSSSQIVLPSYAVADLPTEAESEGELVYCEDGADGSPCLAYCNGTAWLQIALGSEVSEGGE